MGEYYDFCKIISHVKYGSPILSEECKVDLERSTSLGSLVCPICSFSTGLSSINSALNIVL